MFYPQNRAELIFLANFDGSKQEMMEEQAQTERRSKTDILRQLQSDILRLQGFKPASGTAQDMGLGVINQAFPQACFPLGAIHEFMTANAEEGAAATGFLAGLLKPLMGEGYAVLWVRKEGSLFAPALHAFGITPHRVIFLELKKEKDILWAVEEALKCGALAAVIGELSELDFTASRRLQLAVENSKTTGFLLRSNPRNLQTTACVARWKIAALPSALDDDLPGIGFPRWQVELLKIRNGKPGRWVVQWKDEAFQVERPAAQPVAQPYTKIA